MTTNEAAERLWEAIDANWEDSQPPRELFDEAFAAERHAERRATVERMLAHYGLPATEDSIADVYRTMGLDEEAAR